MDLSDSEKVALFNTLSGLYIQSLRLYDLLIVIAEKLGADEDEIDSILEGHRTGLIRSPDPALRYDDAAQDNN